MSASVQICVILCVHFHSFVFVLCWSVCLDVSVCGFCVYVSMCFSLCVRLLQVPVRVITCAFMMVCEFLCFCELCLFISARISIYVHVCFVKVFSIVCDCFL